MIVVIGTIASILWGLSMLPELIRTIKNKKCFLGYGLLSVTITASVLSMIYTSYIHSIPLFFNYLANFVFLVIMLIYKIKYHEK
jgi:uncharacterized protein with PQ loop repeat